MSARRWTEEVVPPGDVTDDRIHSDGSIPAAVTPRPAPEEEFLERSSTLQSR
jgi:hypothetical protein